MTEAARGQFAAPHPVAPPSGSLIRRRLGARNPATSVSDQLAAANRAVRISRMGVWEFDHRTNELTVSDEALELLGVERQALAFGGAVLTEAIDAEDRQAVLAAMRNLLHTGAPISIRFRCTRRDDGSTAWFAARGSAERDDAGQLLRVTCTIVDVTELVTAEGDLRSAHAELLQAHGYQQSVIATVPDAIHVYDVAGRSYSRADRSGAELVGFTRASVLAMSGERLDEVLPLDDWAELTAAIASAATLADGELVQLQHRVSEDDGEMTWLSRRMSVFARDVMGLPSHLLVVTRDVTNIVEFRKQLEHAASHDDLTGLPNRRFIHECVDGFGVDARDGAAALLVVDLDDFKRINDAHGHAIGDAVLIGTAERLVAATRGTDIVARLGGDEFVIIMAAENETVAGELAAQVAARVATALAEPFAAQGLDFGVTASVGITVVGSVAAGRAALVQADAAMYSVKRSGANGHAVFDDRLAERARRDDMIERRLAQVLRADAVDLDYQPIVTPGSGMVHSVEALLRVRDDDGTVIDAAEVVSVAERCGLIGTLDDLVLRTAAEQVSAWRASPLYPNLGLTLNRSAQDILRVGFHDRVMAALAQTELGPDALTIEITETVLLDAAAPAMADITRLYERGVRLAIDDFGTGYASMSQLTKLPISAIKIDRSFIANMLHDRTCRALVRATVGIATDLDMKCIVEGVETEEQLAALPRYRGVLIQGYLYGRPRPAEDGLGISVARW